MRSPHRTISLGLSLGLLACTSLATAQQGDRKGHKMVDPIPADKIPPSPYLSLEKALKTFQLPKGFVIEPVASGEDVNLVVALAFDANGRAWTVEMRSYMPDIDGKNETKPNGTIRVLEDTNGDGKTDKATTFLDGLVLPRAVAVTSDGCLYTSGDALYFIKREGLKPVGKPILVDKDYARGGNPEHKGNGLLYGHDNWYYNAKSNRRYRRIDGKWIYEPTNFRGQWGIAKDNVGRLYYNNNSTLLQGDQFTPNFFRGNSNYTPKANASHRLGPNKVYPIHITPGVNRAYMKGVLNKNGKLANATASCGVHVYRGDNFPAAAQGMGFSCEPGGDLIKAVKIDRDDWNKPSGSHPFGTNEFLATTDEWFLPCNLYTAPDGTLWVVDMYFGLLQHKAYMTTYLRKQYLSRGLDKPKPSTGRIYRVRYQKNAATKVPKLEGMKAAKLVDFLAHPNGTIRDTAQRLIVESGDTSVTPQLAKLASNASKPLGQIHALWTLEGLNKFPTAAFTSALKSSNKDVKLTALNVLSVARLGTKDIQQTLLTTSRHPNTLHALVRAMAANKLADRALDIVLKNGKVAYLREAWISGLGQDAHEFRKKHDQIADGALKKHLANATKKSSGPAKPEGSHLKGAELAAFKRGKQYYTTKAACFGCHGGDGKGMPNLGPPLAPSEWVTGDSSRLAKLLLHGMTGPVVVNKVKYTPAAAMPGIKANLSDQEIADVMTYIRNTWGNKAKPVSPSLVKKTRAATSTRNLPFTEKELR